MTKRSVIGQARTTLRMPFLLTCGMGFATFYACAATVVFIQLVIALAVGGSHTLIGRDVMRSEFHRRMWWLLVLWPVTTGPAAAIAYALWKDLPWSREAIIACNVLPFVALLMVSIRVRDPGNVIGAGTWLLIIVAGMGWYLYRKATVVAYYRAVTEHHARRLAANRERPDK